MYRTDRDGKIKVKKVRGGTWGPRSVPRKKDNTPVRYEFERSRVNVKDPEGRHYQRGVLLWPGSSCNPRVVLQRGSLFG